MPKTNFCKKNPTKLDIIGNTIFGVGVNERAIATMARRTGISTSALYRYRQDPGKIPLDRLLVLMDATGMRLEVNTK